MAAKDYGSILAQTLANVLEDNAFMFAEPCALAELDAPYDTCARAEMNFSGPASGSVWLLFPQGACRELAANIRGIDLEECVAQDGEDALRELLNIICGRFLTEVYGIEPIFQLSIPTVDAVAEEDWEAQFTLENAFGFDLDGTPALAGVALEIAALERA